MTIAGEMRILWLTHKDGTPSTRYRVAAFLPRFEQAGHASELREYSSSIWSLWPLLRAAGRADVVVLQKRLPPPWLTRAIRRRAKRLVYDFDDAVYLKRAAGQREGARDRRFRAVMEAADLVIAGNSHLAGVAKADGAKRVEVIPTVLDPAKYLAASREPHDDIVLGWIGAGGNLPFLEALLPHLPKARVRVVCNAFPPGVEAVPWSEAGEAAALAGMDVGLAPMPDDDWSRGKCGTRVLQYFAAGLPVVADRVGVHADLVEEGVSGHLVSGPAEWSARVGELMKDPAKRRAFGEAGRKRVVERYSVEAVAPRLVGLVTGEF